MKKIQKLIILLIMLVMICITPFLSLKTTASAATGDYTVTFDFNKSHVSTHVPEQIRNTIISHTVEVANNGYANPLYVPESALNSYYTYYWTHNGERVQLNSFRITKDVTLVAVWQPVEYTILYCYSNAEMSQIKNIVYSQTYTVESSRIDFYQPKRDHYIFEDWYANSQLKGNVKIYQPEGSIGDLMLYAKWVPVEYTITYYQSGENLNNPVTYNIEDDRFTLQSPTRNGYIFQGWFSDSSLTQQITTIEADSTGNLSIYASWKKEVYKVTYILPDGSMQVVEVEYMNNAPRPNYPKSIFEIFSTDKSTNRVEGNMTVYVSIVNIWYVYVIGLIIVLVVILAVILTKIHRAAQIQTLKQKYRSPSRNNHLQMNINTKNKPVSRNTNVGMNRPKESTPIRTFGIGIGGNIEKSETLKESVKANIKPKNKKIKKQIEKTTKSKKIKQVTNKDKTKLKKQNNNKF